MQQAQHQSFLKTLGALTTLYLDVSVTEAIFDWTRDLIAHSTGLRSLELSQGTVNSTHFFESLLSAPTLFPGLQRLHLADTTMEACHLLGLLAHCRSSIRTLYLKGVRLEQGAWTSIITEMGGFKMLGELEVIWPREHLAHMMVPVHYSIAKKVDLPQFGNKQVGRASDGRTLRYLWFRR